MTSNDPFQVTLSLEGMFHERGEVHLGDLVAELQALNALLLGLDRAVSPDHKVSTEYRVVDLQRVNPSQVTVGGTPKRGAPDVRALVFGRPFETLERIARGATSGYDYDLLEDLRQLAEPVGKRLRKATLSSNGNRFDLTAGLREEISRLLEPHIISYGFIRGRLEAANVHKSANVFKLYPRVGPTKLTGHFPEHLSRQVGAALGRDVTVIGKIKYRADEPNAYAIEVETIEILPDPGSLPSLKDISGIAPDLTEGLSTEEWLAKRRDEIEPTLRALFGL
jgi:hypothetical protein